MLSTKCAEIIRITVLYLIMCYYNCVTFNMVCNVIDIDDMCTRTEIQTNTHKHQKRKKTIKCVHWNTNIIVSKAF